MIKFRKLEAEEIDVRVGNVYSWGYSLLLYKDARCDMNILDETVGAENWQRDHKEIKGNLYCGVGIKSGDIWSWKWDCGTESNTEKEKGEASDSFKRACVNWGIGRELYTSPNISINCDMNEEKVGTKTVYKIPSEEQKRRFRVKEISYNEKGEINNIVIVDTKGVQVYPRTTTETAQKAEEKKKSQYSGIQCEDCTEDISDKVAKYSKEKFGKYLCYNCQKSQPIEERVI